MLLSANDAKVRPRVKCVYRKKKRDTGELYVYAYMYIYVLNCIDAIYPYHFPPPPPPPPPNSDP
ncbi:unnamed protein product [Camellia sinensis]